MTFITIGRGNPPRILGGFQQGKMPPAIRRIFESGDVRAWEGLGNPATQIGLNSRELSAEEIRRLLESP